MTVRPRLEYTLTSNPDEHALLGCSVRFHTCVSYVSKSKWKSILPGDVTKWFEAHLPDPAHPIWLTALASFGARPADA